MDVPDTRYAKTLDGGYIAYKIFDQATATAELGYRT
jgi:hypothetical protein